MVSVFVLAMLAAIVVSIMFARKKMWKHVGFGVAAVLVSMVGIGFASPAPAEQSNSESTSVVKTQPKIEVKQVQEKKVVEFGTTNKDDGTLAKGTTKVSQEGVNGERTITYEVTYKDGVEQSRKEIKNEITIVPVDKIVLTGTYVYVAPTTTQSSGARTGAICKDGSSSSATGSGACSHHGGVAYWTY